MRSSESFRSCLSRSGEKRNGKGVGKGKGKGKENVTASRAASALGAHELGPSSLGAFSLGPTELGLRSHVYGHRASPAKPPPVAEFPRAEPGYGTQHDEDEDESGMGKRKGKDAPEVGRSGSVVRMPSWKLSEKIDRSRFEFRAPGVRRQKSGLKEWWEGRKERGRGRDREREKEKEREKQGGDWEREGWI